MVDFPKKLHSLRKYLCSFRRNQTIAGLPLLPALFCLLAAVCSCKELLSTCWSGMLATRCRAAEWAPHGRKWACEVCISGWRCASFPKWSRPWRTRAIWEVAVFRCWVAGESATVNPDEEAAELLCGDTLCGRSGQRSLTTRFVFPQT